MPLVTIIACLYFHLKQVVEKMWINIFSVTLPRKMGMAGPILFSSLQKQITNVLAQNCSMF